jgi:hypothetical protein
MNWVNYYYCLGNSPKAELSIGNYLLPASIALPLNSHHIPLDIPKLVFVILIPAHEIEIAQNKDAPRIIGFILRSGSA